MKILKNIFIGLGALFILLMIVFAYISYSSSVFLKDNQQFIEEFAYDYSANWSSDDVHTRLSNEFLTMINSPEGRQAISQVRQLGAITEISDFEMGNYYSGTGGNTGIITFKAVFENAKGVVRITLVEKDNKVRIQGFRVLAPDGLLPSQSAKREV